MTEDQLSKLRESLVSCLIEVVDAHRVHIGAGLSSSDVVGALEWVKMHTYIEAMGDKLLDYTSEHI